MRQLQAINDIQIQGAAMTQVVQAIYERGTLRLVEPVDLEEGTQVEVTISTETPEPDRSPSEILAEIAALPMESSGDISGRDHDRILYGVRPS
jgi:predicted DNA-binding antitoxin AbrB/MazE fold protein